MTFYSGNLFPARYRGAAFIAEHGSWNRSKKSGYRVLAVFIDGDTVTGSEPFLTGFLDGQNTRGRPVDVLVLDDGSVLVSDDDNGAVYRITWRGHAQQAAVAGSAARVSAGHRAGAVD